MTDSIINTHWEKFGRFLSLGMASFFATDCAISQTEYQGSGIRLLDCYDALVKAEIVEQTYSEIPDDDDGSVIVRWPWFLELDNRKTIDGDAPKGRLKVLTVQHTHWRDDLGSRKWLLRKNDQGWFNASELGEHGKIEKCAAGTPADGAFLSNTEQSLDELHAIAQERDAEENY